MFPSTFPGMGPFLSDFLSDSPVLVDEFYTLLKRAIHLDCARKASDLPRDIRDEVVNETIVLLRSPNRASFDPNRGSAESYLYFAAKSAIKNVRVAYGLVTVKPGEDDAPVPVEALLVDEEIADPGHPEYKMHLVVLTNEILERAGQPMRFLLAQIYLRGEDQETVLTTAGLDRFSFRRRCQKIGRDSEALRKCA